jgi:hypothetical protein
MSNSKKFTKEYFPVFFYFTILEKNPYYYANVFILQYTMYINIFLQLYNIKS